MTTELHGATQKLIQEIEKKDRRFRIAQSIFMVLLIIGFIAGGYIASVAYGNEQKKRDEANTAVVDAINKKLNEQSKQLHCVVQFFTLAPDQREQLKIKSVDDCFATEQASVEGEQSPNFIPGQSGPSLIISPSQTTPGLEPITPQPQNPTPTQPPEPSPVEILGVPLCIPLTNVCVRQ